MGQLPSLSQQEIDDVLSHGLMLEEQGNTVLAFAILKLCALSGDLTAITRVADLLSIPERPMDFDLARKLYEQACLKGYWPACANLSVLYRDLGDSVRHQRYLERARVLSGDPQLDVDPVDD